MSTKGKARLTTSKHLSAITAALIDQGKPAPRISGSGSVSPPVALVVVMNLQRDLPGQNVKLLELEANLRSGIEVSPVPVAALPAPRYLTPAVQMMTAEMRAVLDENQRLRAALAEYITPYSSAGRRDEGPA